ncbi:effector-associated domain EAD1-containing protein [Streptomyces sp. NPDC005122]
MLLLDRREFAFDDPQARDLLDVLLAVYDDAAQVRRFLRLVGMLPAKLFRENDSIADVWPRVLEEAALAGKLRDLIQVISDDPSSTAHDIFKTLLTQEPPAGEADPCAALLIGGGRPRAFVNRRELRRILREMLSAQGSRVLIVNGDRNTGKTWTWHLLCHVLNNHCIRPYKIDLSTYAQPAKVSDIVAELSDQLNWHLGDCDPFASEDAQVRRLVNVLKRHMRAQQRDCWLVFDGLVDTALTAPALRLVESIAEAVAEGEAGDRLTVVLIAYDGQLQPAIDPYVWRECLGPISVEDLREFFGTIAASVGVGIEPEVAELLVADVLHEATGGDHDPNAPLPLEKISAAAAYRGRQLYETYGGAGG